MHTIGIVALGIILIAYNPISFVCWMPPVMNYFEKRGHETAASITLFGILIVCFIAAGFCIIK